MRALILLTFLAELGKLGYRSSTAPTVVASSGPGTRVPCSTAPPGAELALAMIGASLPPGVPRRDSRTGDPLDLL
jgi:hypothetical protein